MLARNPNSEDLDMTKGEKAFYTETSDIFKKYAVQEPDHRADLAREIWNAALEFVAAQTGNKSLREYLT
jgi:hypothetical protein